MSLSPEQVRFFRHNGYLRLPTRFAEGHVAALKAVILRDIEEEVEPVVRSNGRVVRISNVWDRGPIFRETITADAILDPLEALLGPNIEFVRNRHNHATLRLRGDGSPGLHRDVLQFTRGIVTVLLYLEESHLENGCTRIVPGTHLFPNLPRADAGVEAYAERVGLREQAVPVPMPAGGLLAIDSLVFHGVGENRTNGSRMSMTLGYHSVDELNDAPNPKRVLVRGERLYRGNDRG